MVKWFLCYFSICFATHLLQSIALATGEFNWTVPFYSAVHRSTIVPEVLRYVSFRLLTNACSAEACRTNGCCCWMHNPQSSLYIYGYGVCEYIDSILCTLEIDIKIVTTSGGLWHRTTCIVFATLFPYDTESRNL